MFGGLRSHFIFALMFSFCSQTVNADFSKTGSINTLSEGVKVTEQKTNAPSLARTTAHKKLKNLTANYSSMISNQPEQ